MQPPNQPSLTDLDHQINQANLRINNFRRKSDQAKTEIAKNRDQISRIIMQKQAMALSLIEQEQNSQRLKQENQQKVSFLRQKNAEKRNRHQKEIQDILTALYLVKAHDASQMRRISVQHEQKLRQMSQSNIEVNKKQIRRAKSEEGRGKQIYWKNKLAKLYQQNQSDKRLKSQALEQKSKNLQSLLNRSQSEQQSFENISEQADRWKRKYITALNLPIKQVANLMEQQIPNLKNNPQLISSSRARVQESTSSEASRMNYEPHMEFSSETKNSEAKLKIVLQSLKKKKRQQHQRQ